MIKTYVIRIKVDTDLIDYDKIEQEMYNLDVQDVDLIEVYDD